MQFVNFICLGGDQLHLYAILSHSRLRVGAKFTFARFIYIKKFHYGSK